LEVKNDLVEYRKVLDEQLDQVRIARIIGTVEEWESERIKLVSLSLSLPHDVRES
jgi:hypothetical protein